MILMADAYDPAEEQPKDTHVSKKDLKWVLIIVVALAAMFYPIYRSMLGQSEKHLCKQNFRGIANAINLYAEVNDDRFPPAYAMARPNVPLLDSKRRPFTWASLISEYMGERTNFKCRSAEDAENTTVQHRTSSKQEILCSYGYFWPRTGSSTYTFRNPQQAVMVTETSNQGARDSFDPLPLLDEEGNPCQDGFLIAYDDSNDLLTKQSTRVTRLAFKGTSALARHEGGNFFLFADGHAATHEASSAKLRRVGSQVEGFWATR